MISDNSICEDGIVVLIFIFPDEWRCWASFILPVAICMSSLEKCLLIISAHFLIGCFLFWCWVVWSLGIFWILTPYQIYRLQISSFRKLPFILFIVSFPVWKLLNLMWSHLFIFVLFAPAWGDRSKKKMCRLMSKSIFCPFSSSIFMDWGLHISL